MQLRHLLLVGTIFAVPTVASAQQITGLYIGAGAGGNFIQNDKVHNLNYGAPGSNVSGFPGGKFKFDDGYLGVGSIGYGFGNGLRAEIEGNYRENDVRNLSAYGTATSGTEKKYGAMVNVLYDFNLAPMLGSGFAAITPYVGVGAGWSHDTLSGLTIPSYGSPSATSTLLRSNTSTDVFAAQAIVGAAYSLDSVLPGLALTAEYRFYAIPQDRDFKTQFEAPTSSTGPRLKLESEFNNSVLIGLRYAFNAAPPPPPPAPAPAPAPVAGPSRSYLVFFDWDRADLTARARQVIADAAQNSTRVQYTRIEVNGYTDTSGTPAYNQRLSERRAQNVADELVRDGVQRNVIEMHGYGETHLLVQTGPGVREPQNRRVEIIYQ